MFFKMANFELQTHMPMVIRAPWLKTSGSTTALVELVDMYPTGLELTGPKPGHAGSPRRFLGRAAPRRPGTA
jgi:arylsulfatase A-like enzyme